jgi:hypothetical protein
MVKTKRGELITDRATVGPTVATAAHTRKSEKALYSFVISLLPFFKPTKVETTSLESVDVKDSAKYFELLGSFPVFSAIAHFCMITKFKVSTKVGSSISKLAFNFDERKEPINTSESGPLADLQAAANKFRPKIKMDDPIGEFQRPSDKRAKAVAVEVVNAALIQTVAEYNDTFKVSPQ